MQPAGAETIPGLLLGGGRPRPRRGVAAHRRRDSDLRRRGRPGRPARGAPARAGRTPRRPRRGDDAHDPAVPAVLARARLASARSRCRPIRQVRRASWPVSSGRSGRGCWSPTPSCCRWSRRRRGRRRRRWVSSTSTTWSTTGATAPRDPAPLRIDAEAGRPGGAHPDVGDHRAVEARHADAPGLRHGRRGLPVLDGAHRGRPADDLAAAVPHQRAGLLGAWARWPAVPGSCCCRGSRPAASSTRPGGTARPSSTRSARCSRS